MSELLSNFFCFFTFNDFNPLPMKTFQKFIQYTVLITFLISSRNLYAQSKKRHSNNHNTLLKTLRSVVEKNPDSENANNNFIDAWGINDSTLIGQYKILVNRYPKSYIMPFVIGDRLNNEKNPNAAFFLLKAVNLNPSLSKGWYALYLDADRGGDSLKTITYLRKAIKTDPKNPDYAYAYVWFFKNKDNAMYIKESLDVIDKFPKSQVTAQTFFWLAKNENENLKKTQYLELFLEKYSGLKGEWSDAVLEYYFNLSLFLKPEKAKEIAILKNDNNELKIVDTVILAQNLIAKGKTKEAYLLIKNLKFKDLYNKIPYLLLYKARIADTAGNTRAAYDSISFAYCKNPNDSLQKAMFFYGKKIGIAPKKVIEHVYQRRDSLSFIASGFNLTNYLSEKKVSLSDYKGKIVLLTYWFPGCGPCRDEFPHFENVIKKVGRDKIIYIGINMFPVQSGYVIPFLKSTGYSFTPLRDYPERDKGNLRADSAPSNYLIDQNGRVVFSNFRIDGDNEHTLELMITELLDHDDKSAINFVDSLKIKN